MKTKLGRYKREYRNVSTPATLQESHAEQEITLKLLELSLLQWSNGHGRSMDVGKKPPDLQVATYSSLATTSASGDLVTWNLQKM